MADTVSTFKATGDFSDLFQKIADAKKQFGELPGVVQQANTGMAKSAADIGGAVAGIAPSFQESASKIEDHASKAGDSLKKMGEGARQGAAETEGAGETLKGIAESLENLNALSEVAEHGLESLWRNMQLGRLAAGGTAVGLLTMVTALGKIGIGYDSMAEQANLANEALLKNKTQAEDTTAAMESVFKGLPVDVGEASTELRQMLALGIPMKDLLTGTGEQAKGLIVSIGDAAAVLGPQVFGQISQSLEYITQTGSITQRELTMLERSGVNIGQIFQQQFGIATNQVDALGKEGYTTQQIIEGISKGLEAQYGGLGAQWADTFQGRLKGIRTDFEALVGKIEEGPFKALEGALGGVVKALSDLADRASKVGFLDALAEKFPQTAAFAKAVGSAISALQDIIREAVPIVQGFAAAFAALVASRITVVFEAIAAALRAVADVLNRIPAGFREIIGLVAGAAVVLHEVQEIEVFKKAYDSLLNFGKAVRQHLADMNLVTHSTEAQMAADDKAAQANLAVIDLQKRAEKDLQTIKAEEARQAVLGEQDKQTAMEKTIAVQEQMKRAAAGTTAGPVAAVGATSGVPIQGGGIGAPSTSNAAAAETAASERSAAATNAERDTQEALNKSTLTSNAAKRDLATTTDKLAEAEKAAAKATDVSTVSLHGLQAGFATILDAIDPVTLGLTAAVAAFTIGMTVWKKGVDDAKAANVDWSASTDAVIQSLGIETQAATKLGDALTGTAEKQRQALTDFESKNSELIASLDKVDEKTRTARVIQMVYEMKAKNASPADIEAAVQTFRKAFADEGESLGPIDVGSLLGDPSQLQAAFSTGFTDTLSNVEKDFHNKAIQVRDSIIKDWVGFQTDVLKVLTLGNPVADKIGKWVTGLFGGATSANPLGAGAGDALKKQAKDIGTVFSEDAATGAREFTATLQTLDAQVKSGTITSGQRIEIERQMVEGLQQGIKGWKTSAAGVDEYNKNIASGMDPLQAWLTLAGRTDTLAPGFHNVAAAMSTAAGQGKNLNDIMQAGLSAAGDQATGLGEVAGAATQASQAIQTLTSDVQNYLTAFQDPSKAFSGFMNEAQQNVDNMRAAGQKKDEQAISDDYKRRSQAIDDEKKLQEQAIDDSAKKQTQAIDKQATARKQAIDDQKKLQDQAAKDEDTALKGQFTAMQERQAAEAKALQDTGQATTANVAAMRARHDAELKAMANTMNAHAALGGTAASNQADAQKQAVDDWANSQKDALTKSTQDQKDALDKQNQNTKDNLTAMEDAAKQENATNWQKKQVWDEYADGVQVDLTKIQTFMDQQAQDAKDMIVKMKEVGVQYGAGVMQEAMKMDPSGRFIKSLADGLTSNDPKLKAAADATAKDLQDVFDIGDPKAGQTNDIVKYVTVMHSIMTDGAKDAAGAAAQQLGLTPSQVGQLAVQFKGDAGALWYSAHSAFANPPNDQTISAAIQQQLANAMSDPALMLQVHQFTDWLSQGLQPHWELQNGHAVAVPGTAPGAPAPSSLATSRMGPFLPGDPRNAMNFPHATGAIVSAAQGLTTLPNMAVIQRGWGAGLVNWAEGSTGDEAFIPLGNVANADRSWDILAESAQRLAKLKAPSWSSSAGRSLLARLSAPSFASGGIRHASLPSAHMAAGGVVVGNQTTADTIHHSRDVHIDEMTVVANDPMEFMSKVDSIRQREAMTT